MSRCFYISGDKNPRTSRCGVPRAIPRNSVKPIHTTRMGSGAKPQLPIKGGWVGIQMKRHGLFRT